MALKTKIIGREALSKRLNEIAPNLEKYAAAGVGGGGGGWLSFLSGTAFAGSKQLAAPAAIGTVNMSLNKKVNKFVSSSATSAGSARS